MKNISLLALVFLVMPLVSSAQTLTASVTTSASSSPAASPIRVSCAPFTRSLSVGESGSDVSALQTYLSENGYLSVSPTGYFGPLTKAAVARWQVANAVVVQGSANAGIFGPLSRASFTRSCGSTTTTQATTFSANPQSGAAPLTVQFTSSAPQGSSVGSSVAFGDGTSGTLAFAPTCAGCNALAMVSHTYTSPGTYTASLQSGNCTCQAGSICNCPAILILATTTVTVEPEATATTTITQLNEPGSVTLGVNGIAEVRSENYYFTLTSLSTSSATIQLTPVGCWNSFPSDPPPKITCMIALVPIPLQTLSVGQSYESGTFNITLTAISTGKATFQVQ